MFKKKNKKHLTNKIKYGIIKIQKDKEKKTMKLIKTLKVELSNEEKDAIRKVIDFIQSMWHDDSLYCEMENLWETYGSYKDGWTCIEETLRNLLNGGK